MIDYDVRFQYKLDHPVCEYCGILRKLVGGISPSVLGAVETDHIWGGTGGRWDVISNLISACRPCHEWKHQHLAEGRIAAYRAKLNSGELNEDEFRQVSGRILRGWLENLLDGELLEGFVGLGRDLLEDLKKGD